MTTTDTPTVDNGVNIEALRGAREALTESPRGRQIPVAGELRVGARDPQPQRRSPTSPASARSTYTVRPTRSTPTTQRSSPPRTTVPPLPRSRSPRSASCLTAGVATVASNRGVQLHSVKATVTAGMDLQGILGIDGDVRNGFDHVAVTYDIDADASRADLEAILAQSQKRSAVFDIITNPTTVQVSLA